MILVVDASVALKWAIPDPTTEEHLDEALELLRVVRSHEATLVQPQHWLYEVAAVLVRLRPRIVAQGLDLLSMIKITVA
ncbi:MAG TPA: PIN domain-containing protein, partial [Thermoanaerobaculia bacterium]|nr:PIN domain-containing protein [Thermoanaerobaculia bacterium]